MRHQRWTQRLYNFLFSLEDDAVLLMKSIKGVIEENECVCVCV